MEFVKQERTGSYMTPDRTIWIRRDFDGIYKWNILRAKRGGGYRIVGSERTLAAAKASVS